MLTTHISDGKKINLIAKRLFLLHKFLPNFYIMQSHTTYIQFYCKIYQFLIKSIDENINIC